MESRLKISGQAVQPILVMFPLGLFAMAVIFDLATLSGSPDILGTLAYWNVVAGLIAGVVATLALAIDIAFVNRALLKRLSLLRVLLNMAVLVLFAVTLMVRVSETARTVGVGSFLLELVALGLACYGAWFSGELAKGRAPAFARAAAGQRS